MRVYSLLTGVVVLVLVAGLIAGCSSDDSSADHMEHTADAATVQTHEAKGVVKAITPSKEYINIKHEDIPGFMDAMTMFFAVKDSTLIEGLAAGDSVSFTIEINRGDVAITSIQKDK